MNTHNRHTERRRRHAVIATSVLAFAGTAGAAGGIASATTEPPADTAAAGTEAAPVDYQWTPNADLLAGAEGAGQHHRVGRLRRGRHRPTGVDWVTPFEEITGCAVNNKLGNTSDEMVQLMQSGEYDGVSASGDATERLIAGGEVGPLDVGRVASYEQIFEDLKLQQWNSVDGEPYGIPHGRGANLLVCNTEAFADGLPTRGASMFDGGTPADGAVSVYDSPIYIADAALYLMATQPDLGITNPYALDETQFAAAVALLEQQEALVGQYWGNYTDQQAALEGRHGARRHDVAGHRQPRAGQRRDHRRGEAGRGRDGLVRHMDAVDEGGEPQLHDAVDGLDRVAVGERAGRRVVRRGAEQPRSRAA